MNRRDLLRAGAVSYTHLDVYKRQVLATFLAAFDADYRLIVIKDCCADLDQEFHQCLVDKYFPRLAAVITASEFQQALASEAQ